MPDGVATVCNPDAGVARDERAGLAEGVARKETYCIPRNMQDGVATVCNPSGGVTLGSRGRVRRTSGGGPFRIYSSPPFTLAETGQQELEERGKAIPEERR